MVTKKITNKSEASPEEIKPKKETGSETSSSIAIKKIVHGQAHISASYNNTLLSITDDNGNMVAWSSAGSLGFKGAKKATPYAATKIVETIMEKIKKMGISDVSVFVRGVGGGREAAIRALANKGMNIISIKDVTPLPHNGCKPKKVRRI
ncbi:MAG: 30S ribosomal subunit protein S11 [Parcubacteria group bacterium GW2011_GWD2_38_12]|nr:MAG: 30S ribosomal subunit protein S11 [Parcubacteria group bacterium GW2011_GWC2_36_17]KKQ43228.1 MAG: 30S ribosomal subunit protein S11 [Parcubacteria group bacterium GW2011_GWE2_37_8]KKQ52913.1 MAG: 30S ribosomal subunit protein S11 [Parcubacteria group bacterium GW2011_GWD2_38_12]KKQ59116.1 MAG: 30S ribosomal subunit protein S11 [Parcubacteria group bacterium GW2011_GWC1_38_17]KKQ59731.1 MAG: 30S ribosomal subunit protein S11 [Parcubacteria group bacterium GW2011_GWD1_38_16]